MRIFIQTQAMDTHGLSVAYALEMAGFEVELWFAPDLADKQSCSVSVPTLPEKNCSVRDGSGREIKADVVWARRPGGFAKPDFMHPADWEFAKHEFKAFDNGLWFLLDEKARWVNPRSGDLVASNKITQLQAARSCGLTVPETLISTDPNTIRDFAKLHRKVGLIMKSFHPGIWMLDNGDQLNLETVCATDEILKDDFALSHCPNIFQPRLSKAYELRVTMFGNFPLAAKIHDIMTERGRLDWRTAAPEEYSITPYELPDSLLSACQRLMKKLGIVFGCFDFIVTPDGAYVFLEVNHMGQFLWVEQDCPSIKMLAAMCAFLTDASLLESGLYAAKFPDLQALISSAEFEAFTQTVNAQHTHAQYWGIKDTAA